MKSVVMTVIALLVVVSIGSVWAQTEPAATQQDPAAVAQQTAAEQQTEEQDPLAELAEKYGLDVEALKQPQVITVADWLMLLEAVDNFSVFTASAVTREELEKIFEKEAKEGKHFLGYNSPTHKRFDARMQVLAQEIARLKGGCDEQITGIAKAFVAKGDAEGLKEALTSAFAEIPADKADAEEEVGKALMGAFANYIPVREVEVQGTAVIKETGAEVPATYKRQETRKEYLARVAQIISRVPTLVAVAPKELNGKPGEVVFLPTVAKKWLPTMKDGSLDIARGTALQGVKDGVNENVKSINDLKRVLPTDEKTGELVEVASVQYVDDGDDQVAKNATTALEEAETAINTKVDRVLRAISLGSDEEARAYLYSSCQNDKEFKELLPDSMTDKDKRKTIEDAKKKAQKMGLIR